MGGIQTAPDFGTELRACSCSRVCTAAAHTLITHKNLISCGQRSEVCSFFLFFKFLIPRNGPASVFSLVLIPHFRPHPFRFLTFLKSFLFFFSYQIFEESRDLPGEHSQVQEASGDLVVILGQVTVPQVLQHLDVLLLVIHVS